ncbi:transcriptional regulator Kaiso-like isoform X1 [Lissotriton helveticus]
MESRKLITATDTQYSGTLLSSLNEQRLHGIFCDVTVIVEDKKFRAHKNILSASSTYFHNLFSVSGQVVELNFVRAEIFAEILNYIYSSKIIGVRTNLLEELIKSGQLLGVRFIADLGIPLFQMKSMTSGVKDNHVKASPSDADQKSLNTDKPSTKCPLPKDSGISATPIVTETSTIPSEELHESTKAGNCQDKSEESDDDVVFCSITLPPKQRTSNDTERAQKKNCLEIVKLPNQEMSVNASIPDQKPVILGANCPSPTNFPPKAVAASQAKSLSTNISTPTETDVVSCSQIVLPKPQVTSQGMEKLPNHAHSLSVNISSPTRAQDCVGSSSVLKAPKLQITSSDVAKLANFTNSLPVGIQSLSQIQAGVSLGTERVPPKAQKISSDIDQLPNKANSLSASISSPSQTQSGVFSSELVPPKSQKTCLDMVKLPTQELSLNSVSPCASNNLQFQYVSPPQINTTSAKISSPSPTQSKDLIFPSGQTPPKPCVSQPPERAQQMTEPEIVKIADQQMSMSNTISAQTPLILNAESPNNLPLKEIPSQINALPVTAFSQAQASSVNLGSSQSPAVSCTRLLNPQHPDREQLNPPPNISTFAQNHLSITMNFLSQQLPSFNTFVNKPFPLINANWPPLPNLLPSTLSQLTNTEKVSTFDGPKPPKPQKATFHKKNTSKPGELKIKIADVNPGSSKDCSGGAGIGSHHIMDGKKIITLDTPSDIGGLSTGCKVYANIGEDKDTYDIVIPIKNDPDEDGEVQLPKSVDGSPNSKRVKVKHDDHYELNVDGKVYYICLVCKRSYVSRTSLKRHYNVHSWERKYPCHYCEKVYALAEYRTKHEVIHTGEKRYQCLTCGGSFINHRIMSNHMKSAHNQDPSGDPTLYLLHPFKSPHSKQSPESNAQPSTSAAVVDNADDQSVDEKKRTASVSPKSSSPAKPMDWNDVFIQPGDQAIFKDGPSQGGNEFEFVIPESY